MIAGGENYYISLCAFLILRLQGTHHLSVCILNDTESSDESSGQGVETCFVLIFAPPSWPFEFA